MPLVYICIWHVCVCVCVWVRVCVYECMHVYIFCTGGLGFSLHNIGISLGIVGVIMIPISVVAFAPVSDFIV